LLQLVDSVVERERDLIHVHIEGRVVVDLEKCLTEALSDRWAADIIHVLGVHEYAYTCHSSVQILGEQGTLCLLAHGSSISPQALRFMKSTS
jgi:hypothetical protein